MAGRQRSQGLVAGTAAMLPAIALLGLAHLVQASVPFPPLGLAQQVLHLVPGPVAVFFVERLGHLALQLFSAGFVAGGILAGGLAGLLVARRRHDRRPPAAWLAAAVLAVVALGGYRAVPGAPSLLLYALLVAVAGGVYATGLLGALGRLDADRVPAPAQGLARTRREFLRALAGAAALLGTGVLLRRVTGGFGDRGGKPLARPAGAPPVQQVALPAEDPAEQALFAQLAGLSPEITPNRHHYVVDESIIDPDVDPAAWHLTVDGLVARPLRLGYDQLLAMRSIEQFVTLQCISNYVGGDLVGTAKWTGVRLADVLALAGGVRTGSVRVVFHAVGGYTDSLPVAKALDPATIVAYGMNGETLPRAHGYPARIIAPGIYGMKNVKWLTRIEVVDYDYRGYWQQSDGWDNIAEIKTASRIDVPGPPAVVKGSTVVAGVAWAGTRGIQGVEVSTDGGRTWRPATLRRRLDRAAWRQWRTEWRPEAAGTFDLQVRATDGTGTVQTADVTPPHPSGATGYDAVEVKADPGA